MSRILQLAPAECWLLSASRAEYVTAFRITDVRQHSCNGWNGRGDFVSDAETSVWPARHSVQSLQEQTLHATRPEVALHKPDLEVSFCNL
jgi:hypothetical protein